MIWNVSVIKSNDNFITGYQFESKDITEAVKQGEKYGEVIKAVLSELDEL